MTYDLDSLTKWFDHIYKDSPDWNLDPNDPIISLNEDDA